MANYYGSGRSNYVNVTDKSAFKKLCEERDLTYWEQKVGKKTLVGCAANTESGYPESDGFDESDEQIEYPDFMLEVSKLLKKNEVFIYMDCGSEKLKYISGTAQAINSKGKIVTVTLADIYEKAKSLGKNITVAEY